MAENGTPVPELLVTPGLIMQTLVRMLALISALRTAKSLMMELEEAEISRAVGKFNMLVLLHIGER